MEVLFSRILFAKVKRLWGLIDLGKLINKVHTLFNKYHEEIERDCTDEEFMAIRLKNIRVR